MRYGIYCGHMWKHITAVKILLVIFSKNKCRMDIISFLGHDVYSEVDSSHHNRGS